MRMLPTLLVLLLTTLTTAACGGADAPPAAAGGAGGRGGGPGAPVEAVTLIPTPVEDVTEFVGTVKSRRSSTIQSQVEGFLTRIAVTSGTRVAPGTVLFEIDSATQQAAVASLESTKAAREADAAYARQQAARVKALFEAGAASQQEVEQSATAVKTTEAQLRAIDDQIRQQRNELGYYRVTAPIAGVVGDIPVRQGERVTRATALTTIDDNSGMEIYLNIPVQRAADLRNGLAVRVLNEAGDVMSTEKITFVAGSVDDATQTVLAKAAIGNAAGRLRTDQFVRAELVWSSGPGLIIPVTAAVRINGQYFVFVAETSAAGTVARQRPVTVGAVAGQGYVVKSGLKVGDRLIVSGIQKIGDGAPVTLLPPSGTEAK
jgi:RND family efflux transporter MFP subunit